MASRNWKSSLFPPVDTVSDAQQVARQGTWAACFVTGVTAALALASIAGVLPKTFPIDGWALIDAGIFAIVAFGIYRMSRIAAVAGLVIYALGRIYMQVAAGAKAGAGLALTIVIILAFINAVRGTFAYHRLQQANATPEIKETE